MNIEVRDLRNGDWYWIHKTVIMDYAKDIGATAILVYNVLSSYSNQQGKTWVSQTTIGNILGYARPTICKAIKVLEEYKLISIERNRHYLIYSLLKVETRCHPTELCHPTETRCHPTELQMSSYGTQTISNEQELKNNINILSSSEKPDNDIALKNPLENPTSNNLPLIAKKENKEKVKNTDKRIKEFIDYFATHYEKSTGQKYFVSGAKEGKLIKGLLASFDLDRLKELCDRFLEINDNFTQKAGHTIGVFYSQINKLNVVDEEPELTDSDRNQIQSEKVFREWTEQLRKEKEAEALNGTD